MPKLTQRFIDSIRATEVRQTFWDDTLRGFGLRVSPPSKTNPGGCRSYVLKYRLRGSRKSRWLTLGPTAALSPTAARRLAGWALAEVAAGRSPRMGAERDSEPEPSLPLVTLARFVPIYIRDHARKEKKATSTDGDQYNLNRFVLPALGHRPLEEIKTPEIAALHARIGAKTPIQANRVLALISVLFAKAVEWNILPREHENPAAAVNPYPETARTRFLSSEELGRVGEAMRSLEQEAENPPAWTNENFARDRRDSIAIIRLYFLTGCRKMEIVTLKKSHIDREWMKLRLLDSKSGPKDITLTPEALAVLDTVEARGDNLESEWVFPGRDPSVHRSEPRRIWHLVRERAGVPDVTIHDIRRTYASLAANANTPPKALQSLLGHARYSTTEKYVQLFDETQSRSARRVASLAAAALSGATDADIVPIRPGSA